MRKKRKIGKKQKKKRRKRRKIYVKKAQHCVHLGAALSLSRSPFLSLKKTGIPTTSLSHLQRPSTPVTKHSLDVTRTSTTSPAAQSSFQPKETAAAGVAATPPAPLPTPTPATTGHRFRRHHHRDNHLDLHYPTVSIGTPFVTVENLSYCSPSSSLHAAGVKKFTPRSRLGWALCPAHPEKLGWKPMSFGPDPTLHGLKAQTQHSTGPRPRPKDLLGLGPYPNLLG